MKIGCFGNMNNNLFSMVRYFRLFGLDAELLVFDKEQNNFVPQSDMLEENIPSWVKQVSWGSARNFFFTSKNKIYQDVSKYDVKIGCGFSPAYMAKANLSLDIFVPYGFDLYFLVLKNRTILKNKLWLSPLLSILRKYQVKGLKDAFVAINCSVDLYRKSIEYLTSRQIIKYYPIEPPHIYSPEYDNIKPDKLKYSDFFINLRKKHDIIVFNHCRQIWKTKIDDASWKGNDVMIKGFAEYIKRAKKKAVLVCFEYGVDVGNSKALISDLGIERHVVWCPGMYRKEIIYGLSLADFGSDILVPLSTSVSNGTSNEVLMVGKPLFRCLPVSPEEYSAKNLNRPFPPIINVNKPEDITHHLLQYERNPNFYKEIGLQAKEWFNRYMGIGLAEKWVYILSCIYENRKIEIERLLFN